MKRKGKTDPYRVLLLIEAVCMVFTIWKCLDSCTSMVFDPGSFEKVFDGELMYFGDDAVGMEKWPAQEAESQGAGAASEQTEGFELMDCRAVLGSGAYSIRVEYDSLSSPDGGNIDHSAGSLMVRTEYGTVLRAADLRLADSLNSAESVMWLRPGSGRNEVRFVVWYSGNGKLAVKSIQIVEKRVYRVALCLALGLFMIFLNFMYLVFVRGGTAFSDERTKTVIAGILGIVLFSSMICFADFLYVTNGHDLTFHLSRIMSLAEGIRELQIPNRMQFGMLNGYGYASPLFYGELFLLLPAVLYNFFVPLQTCYQVFVVVVNLCTCLVSFWCFARMSGDWKKGLFGAFLYTLSAYRMTNIMIRAAVGEYTAMVFLPLLVYGFWHIYAECGDEKICLKDCLPVILSASGLINSHMLSCEMAVLFVLLFAVCEWKRTFRKHVFLALVKSAVLILLLNLWFVFPFLQSARMDVNLSGALRWMECNSVYPSQLFGIFHTGSGVNTGWSTKGEMPLALGMALVSGLVLYLWIAIRKDRWHLPGDRDMKTARICMVFGMLATFLASSFCWWDNLLCINTKLANLAGMLQFPWRFLGIATVFFTVMVLFLIRVLEKHVSGRATVAVMIAIAASAVLTEGHFLMEYVDKQDGIRVYTEADLGTMTVMGAEYKLSDTDLEGYKRRDVLFGDAVEAVSFLQGKRGTYELSCTNQAENPSYADIPVQMYDNYHAYAGSQELALTRGENNRIRVQIPAGFSGTICIRYKVPLAWRFSEAISGITVCALVWFCVRSKKGEKIGF